MHCGFMPIDDSWLKCVFLRSVKAYVISVIFDLSFSMLLSQLPELPADPLLGLSIAYREDSNPDKVDLGVGVYKDADGNTPIMAAVLKAQALWAEQEQSKVYAPPVGFAGFNEGILNLLLGENHSVLKENRAVSVQTPGGCGALRVAAGMLTRCQKHVRIWVSTPTWANHIPLLGSAGLQLIEYPYYDFVNHKIDFDAMLESLSAVQAGDLVLLHGCCHNPSGADLTLEQWQIITKLLNDKNAVPFIDIAYQGLGDGLVEDAAGLRYVAEHCPEVIIANSCSKSFGLYRERVGSVIAISNSPKGSDICRSQLVNVARELYSMPPSHGAAIVDIILHNAELTQLWQNELAQMRSRIQSLRSTFAQSLQSIGFGNAFDFIESEKGMFSFIGLTPEQVQILRDHYSIYMAGTSRVNVAGLNENNLDYVINAIKNVAMQSSRAINL